MLTVAEVAAMARVSKMTIYRLVRSGELAAVRVGRSFRLPRNEVKSYLAPGGERWSAMRRGESGVRG